MAGVAVVEHWSKASTAFLSSVLDPGENAVGAETGQEGVCVCVCVYVCVCVWGVGEGQQLSSLSV